MVNYTILAGGFSSFIATYVLDTNASTLSLTKQNPTGDNPSWIAAHPEFNSIIYATNEVEVGQLQSFLSDSSGELDLVDSVPTSGNGPTFSVLLSNGDVVGCNFGSGSTAFAPTNASNPLQFVSSPQLVNFSIGDAVSQPHMALEYNGEIFIPDLAQDKIWRVGNQTSDGTLAIHGQINIDAGAGPRHIAIYNNVLFTAHETVSTLTAQLIPEGPNGTTLPLIANVSVVPAGQDPSIFRAAEILLAFPTDDTTGNPNPLLYTSNRNQDVNATIGDTIAIFEFDMSKAIPTTNTKRMLKNHRRLFKRADTPQTDMSPTGALKLLNQVPTDLFQIRSMAFGNKKDGSDNYLIAGANTHGGVEVFIKTDGGRNLTLFAGNTDIGNRTSFVFL